MKKHLKWIIPVAAVVVGFIVFGYLKFFSWTPERQVLAIVNDRKITMAQFDRELAKVPPPYQEVFREEPKQYLDQLVTKETVLREARRLEVKADPAAEGEDVDLSIMQNLFKNEVLDKIRVDPKEVAEVYKQHKDQMGKKSLHIPPEARKVIFLNSIHAQGDEILKDGAWVGAFPPVAGG